MVNIQGEIQEVLQPQLAATVTTPQRIQASGVKLSTAWNDYPLR